MKIARFVLKLVALTLAVGAAACCIVAFWDKIVDGLSCARDRISERHACHCHSSEYDDYADWDE